MRLLAALHRGLTRVLARVAVDLLEVVLGLIGRSERTVGLPLLPGLESFRWHAGRLRAWRTAERAAREVPAYRDLLKRDASRGRPEGLVRPGRLDALPVTDKQGYVSPHRIEELCRGGRLPRHGVVLDESSGSSGTPTSWARGRREREATAVLLRATFRRSTAVPAERATGGTAVDGSTDAALPSLVDDEPIVLNAFALGAWATGLTVTGALAPACRLKSVGPDRDKVVTTMLQLGPRYRFVVLGYPPFLKDVADDPRIDLGRYDVVAGFGGEGISENMRAYLLRHYRRVIGSYGASDLEINLAAETDLTIALRRELTVNASLRMALTGSVDGPLPMLFQYNPLDHVLETNAGGELLVTVARRVNLSPRIRYNIHDLGQVVRPRRLRTLLRENGASHLLGVAALDLPILLHGGRSDASVDFYGAVVTVDEIREALYAQEPLAAALRSFRLLQGETADGAPRLDLAVELQPGQVAADHDAVVLAAQVLGRVRSRNGDFDHACRIAAAGSLPELHLHTTGEGVFAEGGAALKHRYVGAGPTARERAAG